MSTPAAADPRFAASIAVEVAYSPRPGVVDVAQLRLPAASTLADALHASGFLQRHGLDAATLRVGIWCKARELSTVLRERDRIEIYRPLLVDPKEARRQRYRQHKETLAARAKSAASPPPGKG